MLVNASFSTNVRIQTGDAEAGIAAPFARCTPNGCFADFDIKDDVLKKFRTATGAGKLFFADAGGNDVSVPLSFNGFNQAFDTLLSALAVYSIARSVMALSARAR